MDEIDWQSLPKKERKKLKRELEREEGEKGKRNRRLGYWVIGLIGIGLLIVGGWWLVRELTKPLPGQQLPEQGRDHVRKEEWEKFSYNSNPPTSGSHDAVWTKSGVYSEPEGAGHLVHSLEHGYVIINYRCGEDEKDCLAFVDKLKERVNKDLYKLILMPWPTLETNFALTAWTRIDKFSTRDANMERVENFTRAFRNHGPEQTIE